MEEKPIDTGTGLLHAISCSPEELPERFQNPFRYAPCPAVVKAAEEVMRHINTDLELDRMFREGKMLGVLIVRMPEQSGTLSKEMPGSDSRSGKIPTTDTDTPTSRLAFLAAFSGNVCGYSSIPYFVAPIFDLLDPEGHFKKEEARISELNREILRIQHGPEYISASENLQNIKAEKEMAVSAWKERMASSKHRRERIRECLRASVPVTEEDLRHYTSAGSSGTAAHGISPEDIGAMLTRESQFEKAELRRITGKYLERTEEAASSLSAEENRIRQLKEQRKEMSDRLQKWIFDSFTVMNALGESRSISAVFSEKGLVPPGGTGECAAPKLLQYAFSHGLQPVAMGEFWYGESPDDEIRSHGRFYPSCNSKCGPLLGFMLQGMDTTAQGIALPKTSSAQFAPDTAEKTDMTETAGTTDMAEKAEKRTCHIIYEDSHLAVIDKPPGIPSVPGKTGMKSVLEILRDAGKNVLEVHRLDMDTSGLMVFAKNRATQRELRRQFECRETEKEYAAVLDMSASRFPISSESDGNITGITAARLEPCSQSLRPGEKGVISLPVSPDFNDRPRQTVDRSSGKEAVTEYEITAVKGSSVFIKFHPMTGRTHQLRVHSAHTDGLGAPIAGDRLYGSPASAPRLCLHASSLAFTHPVTGKRMQFSSLPEWTEDNAFFRH